MKMIRTGYVLLGLFFGSTSFAVDLVSLSLPTLTGQIYQNQTYYNVELRITNNTRGPMHLNYLYDTQYPAGFTVSSSTCTAGLLAQNGYCSIYGTYKPSAAGQNTWSTKVAVEGREYQTLYSVSTNILGSLIVLANTSANKLAAFTNETQSGSIFIFNPSHDLFANLSASVTGDTTGVTVSSNACGTVLPAQTFDLCNISYAAPTTDSGSGVAAQVITFHLTYTDGSGNSQEFTTKFPIIHVDRGYFMALPTDSRTFYGLSSNQINSVTVSGQSIYLGTPAGAVLSPNGGQYWATATRLNGLGSSYVTGMTSFTDGSGNTTIYAATQNGLALSTNGGVTFTNRTGGLASPQVNSVYVDSNGTVYVATQDGLNICTNSNCSAFTTPIFGTVVYAVVVYNGRIYAATSTGLQVSNSVSVPSFAVSGISAAVNNVIANNYVIYASEYNGQHIYECTGDCGHSGGTIQAITNGTIQGMAANGYAFYVASTNGLAISADGGTTFPILRTSSDGLGNDWVNAVYTSGDTVYAATLGGFSTSVDGGVTFDNTTSQVGLTHNLNAQYIETDFTTGSTVYLGTNGYGLTWGSDSDGEQFTSKVTFGTGGTDDNTVNGIYAYNAGQNIYVGTNTGLQVSNNYGTAFTKDATIGGTKVYAVSGYKAVNNSVVIYVATDQGLYYSSNGNTFSLVNDTFLARNPVYAVYANNFNGINLGAYVGTGPLGTDHFNMIHFGNTIPTALQYFTLGASAPYPTIRGVHVSPDTNTIYAYAASTDWYYSSNGGTGFTHTGVGSVGAINGFSVIDGTLQVYLAAFTGLVICNVDCSTIVHTYGMADGFNQSNVLGVSALTQSVSNTNVTALYARTFNELFLTHLLPSS